MSQLSKFQPQREKKKKHSREHHLQEFSGDTVQFCDISCKNDRNPFRTAAEKRASKGKKEEEEEMKMCEKFSQSEAGQVRMI